MTFQTLTAELQNILNVNHSYITKWFVFLSLILLSSYYIFVIWKEHKPTKYILVAGMRLFYVSLSFVYLIASPLTLLLMSPEYDFYDFYNLPLKIYGVIASVIFLFFFIDMMRYGIFVLLKLAGLDINDDNVNEIARQIEHNKHFLKFNKRKK